VCNTAVFQTFHLNQCLLLLSQCLQYKQYKEMICCSQAKISPLHSRPVLFLKLTKCFSGFVNVIKVNCIQNLQSRNAFEIDVDHHHQRVLKITEEQSKKH